MYGWMERKKNMKKLMYGWMDSIYIIIDYI